MIQNSSWRFITPSNCTFHLFFVTIQGPTRSSQIKDPNLCFYFISIVTITFHKTCYFRWTFVELSDCKWQLTERINILSGRHRNACEKTVTCTTANSSTLFLFACRIIFRQNIHLHFTLDFQWGWNWSWRFWFLDVLMNRFWLNLTSLTVFSHNNYKII